MTYFFIIGVPSQTTHTVPPTEAQEFKFQSLWGNVYFIHYIDKGKRGREKGRERDIETEIQSKKNQASIVSYAHKHMDTSNYI